MNRKMLSLLLVLVLTLGAFGTTAFAEDKEVHEGCDVFW